MDKYYTPDVKEFHIGFELEYRNPGEVIDWYEYKWGPWIKGEIQGYDIKCISPYLDFTNLWTQYLGCNYPKWEDLYRVKYLDKEDIESCGFVFHAHSVNGKNPKQPKLLFVKEGVTLNFRSEANHIVIFIGSISVFDGIIKNLSELKVLLKQLGIDG